MADSMAPQATSSTSTPAATPGSGGSGTAGLVLGIFSILFSWFWPLGLLFGILGIIFSGLGMKARGKSAMAGLILSIIGLGLTVILTIAALLFFSAMRESGMMAPIWE